MPQGGVLSLAVLLPSLLWMLLPPLDAPRASNDVSQAPWRRALEWVEGVSRGFVFAIPIFCDLELRGPAETAASAVLGVALAFYYAAWVRYFTVGRQMRALYAPLLAVPVPLAVTPVVYFAAASVLLHSWALAVAVVLFAVSHVPLSRRRARRFSRISAAPSSRRSRAPGPLAGRTCVVTGANSGIGKATCIELAARGASVVMVCRDGERGQAARDEVVARALNADVRLFLADLSEQAGVRALAARLQAELDAVHVLVHSAGASYFERATTAEGVERTFALNVVAPFLLTRLLLPKLVASAPARVVVLTGYYKPDIALRFSDLQLEHGYSGMLAVHHANLGKILLTEELARRLNGTGVTVNSVFPGPVHTALQHKLPRRYRILVTPMLPFFQTPAEGARGPVHLAVTPELAAVSGRYFRGARLADPLPTSAEEARRLWQALSELTNTADPVVAAPPAPGSEDVHSGVLLSHSG